MSLSVTRYPPVTFWTESAGWTGQRVIGVGSVLSTPLTHPATLNESIIRASINLLMCIFPLLLTLLGLALVQPVKEPFQ